jgi:hypothetical protein
MRFSLHLAASNGRLTAAGGRGLLFLNHRRGDNLPHFLPPRLRFQKGQRASPPTARLGFQRDEYIAPLVGSQLAVNEAVDKLVVNRGERIVHR